MKSNLLRACNARSASVAAILALVVIPGATFGAAINWLPDEDGFWDIPANWSSNPSLPGAGDDVTINVGGAVVRIITHRIGTSTIRTINNAETVDVTNASTLNISSGGLGSINTGTLQANNGTLNLLNSALNNTGGTLSAINGGRINLSNGTVINGGTLSTASSGAILTAVGTSATLNGVTLSTGAQYIGSNASSTTLIGTITNSGTITLSSGGNTTDLVMSGNVTLTGSGSVLMGNNINNRIVGGAGSRLINTVGHTIQGGGQIGGQQIAITNSGLIIADQPAGMTIDPNATGMINTGTVRAANGATLDLTGNGGGTFTNTGGTIEAQAGSTVRLINGAVVTGGTLLTSGTGVITTPSGGASQQVATLDGVTIASGSQFIGAFNSQTTLLGTITNNGTMSLTSNNLAADFFISGDVTLTGSGVVSMGDNAGNRIRGGAGGRLINDAGHTIQGAGQVGDSTIAITNLGLIAANLPTAMVVDPNASGMINSGTLRATNGGTLSLTGNGGGSFDNTLGTIEAQNGSTVRLINGAVITGGTLTTSGTGIITTPVGGAVQETATLDGVTVSAGSRFVGVDNSATTLRGALTNNGTISLASTGQAADFVISGDVTLTGGGVMQFSDSLGNRIRGGASSRLINSAGHTIQGSGQIGIDQIAITNAGLIESNLTAGMGIAPNANGMINSGTLRASNGAAMTLSGSNGGTFNNAGGTIEALDGSFVRLVEGATIIGGTLTTSGTGMVVTPAGGATQQTATLNGVTLSSGSRFFGVDNSATTLVGTISNAGVLGLTSTGQAADFVISGDVTLTGSGLMSFSDNLGNRVRGGASSRLINSAGHTIRGSGQIGLDQIALTNAGLIVANQAAGMVIDPNANGMINTGTVRATNGATLILTGNGGGAYNNTGGTFEAQNNSTVQLTNGATINGGTLTTSGTGVITTPAGGATQDSSTLNGVTVSTGSQFVGALNSQTTLIGTITNNGTMSLASNGLAADFVVSGDVTLAGSGVVSMGDNLGNRIRGGAGSTLTNAAGHTIQGAGQIGLGAIGLTNQGLIVANQPSGIAIQTSSAIVNSGTLQANSGSALTLASAVNNSGSILANGGTVNANAGFTGTGTARIEGAGSIVMGAAGTVNNLVLNGTGTLALGANNITVNGAYSNANFGIGNSYNPRANVSGPGQIRAGGNVAQAINGANVTNGTTGNATLTIGNVRVGENTLNYTIANSGTTGPALSGALQTTVNGGNITDARLSGSGVTASNWGPVGTGSTTGNRSVTFTTATAGALAPLTGQVVHIANNFDNVADQNLNIVLAGGAAAYNLAAGSAAPTPVVLANQRVGGSVTQALTVTNTAPAGLFTEGLNASFVSAGGDAQHNGGSINLLAGGASNNSAMSVGVNSSVAGARSGTVTLFYVSDGAGTSGLGQIGVGSQVINVSGNVYQIAQPALSTVVNLGNVHVGSNASQSIVIGNTLIAPAGFQEGLDVTVGGTTGGGAGTGSISNLAAGSTSNAVSVGLNGIGAGSQNGTVTLNLASNGTGTSGLANLALAPAVVQVNATGYNLAAGNATPTPVVLGNQRIGGTATQALTVTNTAPVGAFTEGLNATFGANTGNATNNSASIGLLAGGASNASMAVGVDTSAAGARSGTVTLNYVSDGAGTSGLGVTSVGSQTINVSGNVYQVAQPVFASTTVNLGNVRVGGTAQQALGLTNTNIAPSGFQEGLSASIGGATGGISANGSFTNLAAGSTNNSALVVGLNTATAGARTGSASVNLVSTGAGTSGLTDLTLGTQTINVSGSVYQVAAGQLNTASLNFGTVQVGQSVSQLLSISNVATGASGYVEDLNARFGASSGTGANLISGTGQIANLLAGSTNSSGMTVNVNTGSAATIDGAIAINFYSAGAVNGVSNGLGELGVGSANFLVLGTIQGQVINQAVPVINTPTISLGNVRVGDAAPTQFVSVTNQATTAPQAALNASISTASPLTASGSFNLLAPSATNNSSLQVGMTTATAGSRNGTATLSFVSDASNVGGCEPNCQLALPSQNVNITGGVYQIAQANLPASVNLGNFRLGSAPSQAIAISNTNVAPAGYQEGLDASVGAVTGSATASGGPISNLAQGATSNAVSVGINNGTAVAGVNSGTVTMNLASNGTGTSGLATLNLASQLISVTGTGYNAAAGSALPSPVVLGNQRVGGSGSQVLTIANTAAAGAFSEDLNASFGASAGNAIGSGALSGRLAGSSNTGTGSMSVAVDTSVAGARSGTVTINYQTAGAVNGVSNGLGVADVGNQVISVSGNVYQVAAGQIVTAPLNFGTVQVGQLVSQNLVIRNTASGASGFVEDLNASFGAAGDVRISGVGGLNGILAGTNSSAANGTMTSTSTRRRPVRSTAASPSISRAAAPSMASATGSACWASASRTTGSSAPSRRMWSTRRGR